MNSSSLQLRTSRNAFTLTELLVVGAIVAVLLALLMPVIGKAIDNSRQTRCMGNLKQIGVAVNLYAADNRGYLPWAFGPKSLRWEVAILPYLGQYKTWGKGDTKWHKSGPYTCPSTARNYWLGYGWNYDGIGHSVSDPRGGPTRIGQKGDCVMIADSIKAFNPEATLGEVNMIYPKSGKMQVPRPHRNGLNTLYVDGRVEWFLADDWYDKTTWR